jgi:hypothetical protein
MGALSGAAVLAAVLAQPLVALLTRPGPQVAASVYAMTLVAWLISLIGLLPVVLLGPLGVMQTVWGYFLGSALRVMLGLAGWYLVSTSQQLPADMTGLALVAAYLPLLFVEVGFVARYLWDKDAAARSGASAASQPSVNPADSKVLA